MLGGFAAWRWFGYHRWCCVLHIAAHQKLCDLYLTFLVMLRLTTEIGWWQSFLPIIQLYLSSYIRRYFVQCYFGSVRKFRSSLSNTYWFSTICWSLPKSIILLGLAKFDFPNSVFLCLLTGIFCCVCFMKWSYLLSLK